MEPVFKIGLPRNRAAQKEMSEKEPVFLKQIEKTEKDLKITQATYGSLNALHTAEVGKLAKFGGGMTGAKERSTAAKRFLTWG